MCAWISRPHKALDTWIRRPRKTDKSRALILVGQPIIPNTHFPIPRNSVGLNNGLEALCELVGLIVRGRLLCGGDGLDD